MHVLKLVYLCHGWMLGIFGRPLIVQPVEAWRYGPVVPVVYHTYKAFGGDAIDVGLIDHSDEFDQNEATLLGAVLDAYKDYSAWDLSAITHQPGTPWHTVYKGGRGEGAIIPNNLIRKHYKARVGGDDTSEHGEK